MSHATPCGRRTPARSVAGHPVTGAPSIAGLPTVGTPAAVSFGAALDPGHPAVADPRFAVLPDVKPPAQVPAITVRAAVVAGTNWFAIAVPAPLNPWTPGAEPGPP